MYKENYDLVGGVLSWSHVAGDLSDVADTYIVHWGKSSTELLLEHIKKLQIALTKGLQRCHNVHKCIYIPVYL